MKNWKEENDSLIGSFEFNNFIEAWAFLTKVAILAEKQNHHPTIENTYNKVTLTLTTHDSGNTITDKDRKLANSIDDLLG